MKCRYMLLLLMGGLLGSSQLSYAQEQPCGRTVLCSPTRQYPYRVCENNTTVVKCFNYGDIPLPSNVLRAPYPIDFKIGDCPGGEAPPNTVTMPNRFGFPVVVYYPSEFWNDVRDAWVEGWWCVCPSTSSSGCEIHICWSDSEADFTDPKNQLGRAFWRYSSSTCEIDCSQSIIILNNTRTFRKRANDAEWFFRNGRLEQSVDIDTSKGYKVFSLRDVVMHEMGHILGFPHYVYEDSSGGVRFFCDAAHGIMAGKTLANAPNEDLSQDDKCMFAMLYCPTIVPVEDDAPDLNVASETKAAPNPFGSTTTVEFNVEVYGPVSIRVFNSVGVQVSVLKAEVLAPGTYERQIDAMALAEGAYYCVIQTATGSQTQEIVVMR